MGDEVYALDEEMEMEMDWGDGSGHPPAEPEPVNVRKSPYDFDYFVIGGGSGGLASAKEAAALGAKVGLADFVKPTPKGTKWGLGGTCVNVGCIPKKLMHFSSFFGEFYDDQRECGWNLPEQRNHVWKTMVTNVQKHIKSLNWGYRIALMDKEVEYFNNYAVFQDPHTVSLHDITGREVKKITSEHFLIAVGGRPSYGDLPGAEECCFTSDDLFSMPDVPQNILVVGASYIALECAGFLRGFGRDVNVMVRSIFLRGFDQDMAVKIGENMEHTGVKFIHSSYPLGFSKTEDGKVLARFSQDGEEKTETFDGVLLAIGRYAVTSGIKLENAGVSINVNNGKVICDEFDRSNVPHIWAIGDVSDGKPELTPVAIVAGELLAKRLFGGSVVKMDYEGIPTTVFTPLEYSCCGLGEEKAYEVLGEDNVEVYHSMYLPLEWNFLQKRKDNRGYVKLVCDKLNDEKVIGIHYLGPNAGEVMQGFAVALKAGATKKTFDTTIGIHPTCAEEFTRLKVTKASGKDAQKGGC